MKLSDHLTGFEACEVQNLEKKIDEANSRFMRLLSLIYELKTADCSIVSLDEKVQDITKQMSEIILAGKKDEEEI